MSNFVSALNQPLTLVVPIAQKSFTPCETRTSITSEGQDLLERARVVDEATANFRDRVGRSLCF